jgi:hypothetical protein
LKPAVLVELLGPADPVPDGIAQLRCSAPPGYDLVVCAWLSDQVVCMATHSPERALAAAHAAAEFLEDLGRRPRVVFGSDGRQYVSAAAQDAARQEDDGRHRSLVNEMRPRWDMAFGASSSLLPSTRH